MKQRFLRPTVLLLSAGLPLTLSSGIAMAKETPLTDATGFAKCNSYIQVRATPDQEGDVIGKLYNHGTVEILEKDENGWLRIHSGNVDGYVASQFIATGEEARSIAQTAGYTTAEVGAAVLNVRAGASEESAVVGAAAEKDKLEVVEQTDKGDWVKVVLPENIYGYVSADYVHVSTEYATAYTLEEDALRQAPQSESPSVSSKTSESDLPAASSPAAPAEPSYEETNYEESSYQETYEEAAPEETYYEEAYEEPSYQETYYEEPSYQETYEETAPEETYYEETYEEPSYQETYYEEPSYQETYEETAPEETYYEETYEEPSYSSTGQAIVDYACQFVGNPYVWGGTSLTNGADCSGFVMSVFANFGISLPRTADAQAGYGYAVSTSELQPGDLMFYTEGNGISHVAIYMGNDMVVHAANSSKGICTGYAYYNTLVCCRRLV